MNRFDLKKLINKYSVFKKLLFPVLEARKMYYIHKDKYYDDVYNQIVNSIKGSVIVNIPEIDADIELNIKSDLLKRIIKTGGYEPRVTNLIKNYLNPEKDAIDVGANVGIFSVFMAKQLSVSRKILAIEPTPESLIHLKRNIKNNNLTDLIIVEEKAASYENDFYEIKVIPGMEEYSTIGKMVLPDTKGKEIIKIKIEGNTIDYLVDKHSLNPGLIKIDTEGYEYNVLKGSKITLQKFKPVIIMELVDEMLECHQVTSAEIMKFIESYNYHIIDINRPDHPIEYPFNGEVLALPQ